jgi:phosphatidate cytidylyltransferase
LLRERILVAVVLLPIGLALIYFGGWAFSLMVALILGLAAWEYARIFKAGSHRPADVLLIGGVVSLALGRAWNGFESAHWLLALLVLASMTYHLFAYERGRDQAASDFAVTVSGILYIGWLGAYLISLRDLPDGMWWVLIALPAVCWQIRVPILSVVPLVNANLAHDSVPRKPGKVILAALSLEHWVQPY